MRTINLTQGKVALVDDEDFEALNQQKWYAHKMGNTFYAERNIPVVGKQTTLRMHWEIMNGKSIDHIDHDGLNNQRTNLRFCSQSENCMNTRKCENTTSIYKGVCWNKRAGKWQVYIMINGKRIHLGYFDSETEAAKAYNEKAIELFIEFANLNIMI